MILTRFLPGRAFKVRSDFPIKTKGLLANSTGFVVCPHHAFSADYRSVPICGKVQLVLTRKGKKGKKRIELVTINTPILYDEELAKNHKTKYINIYSNAQVLEVEPFTKNLLTLNSVDFIAWCYAYKVYIYKLYTGSSFKLKKLPNKAADSFNVIEEISGEFNMYPHDAIEKVSSLKLRLSIVTKLRHFERVVSNDIIKRLTASIVVNEQSFNTLLSLYKKYGIPQKYIKKTQALKYLIKRDGLSAITTHLK